MFVGTTTQKAALLIFVGCVTFAGAYEENVLSTDLTPSRELLTVKETKQIYSGETITRSLGAGQVYFACSMPNSFRVDDCMGYEYVSTAPIIAFVVNRTVYQNARGDKFVNMEHFTYDSIVENSLCLGPKCTRSVDFGQDREWCLAFANVGVPNLNYDKTEEEVVAFSYSFNTCISKADIPVLVLQGGVLMVLVVGSLGLCTFWLFKFWKKLIPVKNEVQGKLYTSTSSLAELNTPLLVEGK